ncbi:glycosyltransferase family 2 protein [Tardiphaga sp. 862_B3_N1_1]|uniref:glycosyltransferase family 2 protein n=1 Tax=Tardiphaga sp. 862_B3_N1_1 TaxID=3240763 RepID=UPI003F898BD7
MSMVSHGQAHLAKNLLGDLKRLAADVDILITSNIPEREAITSTGPNLRILENSSVKGFGANHNAALKNADHAFFCVSNPDIRLHENPFIALRAAMNDPTVGLVAPIVTDPSGVPEDSARQFPTLTGLLKKAAGVSDGRLIVEGNAPVEVDWTAGMFMFVRAQAFKEIGGFDEDFFLYYEDVDICVRLWKAGWKVAVVPTISVVHEAQRSSHRDLRFARRHFASLARYMVKHIGRLPNVGSPASRG